MVKCANVQMNWTHLLLEIVGVNLLKTRSNSSSDGGDSSSNSSSTSSINNNSGGGDSSSSIKASGSIAVPYDLCRSFVSSC